jgi:hypothetical protein
MHVSVSRAQVVHAPLQQHCLQRIARLLRCRRPAVARAAESEGPSASGAPAAPATAAANISVAAPPPPPPSEAATSSVATTSSTAAALADAAAFLERELAALFTPAGSVTRSRYSRDVAFRDPLVSLRGIDAYVANVRCAWLWLLCGKRRGCEVLCVVVSVG